MLKAERDWDLDSDFEMNRAGCRQHLAIDRGSGCGEVVVDTMTAGPKDEREHAKQ